MLSVAFPALICSGNLCCGSKIWAAKVALERPASEVILQQANLSLDCFCPVGLFLSQLEHFVSLFITCQRRHHLQKSLGMQFNHCSVDLQSGDYALKLFLHGP